MSNPFDVGPLGDPGPDRWLSPWTGPDRVPAIPTWEVDPHAVPPSRYDGDWEESASAVAGLLGLAAGVVLGIVALRMVIAAVTG